MLKGFVRPVISKVRQRIKPSKLFDGDDRIFRREAERARCYGEYGMGLSTRWMLENTKALVVAVDTSKEWVDSVSEKFPDEPRLDAGWIDVGAVGDWGYPKSYHARGNFHQYREYIWRGDVKPDLVLIDGRFRVACFLQSMISARAGARVIFDDYTDRPHYHIIEELIAPAETFGRQALFIMPQAFDRSSAFNLMNKFEFVRD